MKWKFVIENESDKFKNLINIINKNKDIMKKLSIFACVLAFVGLAFTACGGQNEPTIEIADGFYVVGPATTVDSINVQPAVLVKALMASGFNEAEKAKRDGMYEKYIALEADKEFSLVLRETNNQSEQGYDVTVYGANLKETEAITENAEISVMMYWGQLEENVTMKVPVSGLYHIILDLNKKGDLTSTGGAQIAIAPVNWGIRGGFIDASWNNTVLADATTDFDKEHIVATWNEVEVRTAGAFKFVSQDCWKIQLDQGGQVKAETSIGQANGEMTTIGESLDIPLERGVWKLVLAWDLKGGPLGKSFTYTPTKVRDLEIQDYSNCEMELVGSAVADQAGAVEDASSWKWGNVLPIGKPTREGDVFTWKKEGVSLIGGEKFKVRTPNAEAQGDIAAFDNGDDVAVAATDVYTVTFTLDAASGDKKVKLEGSVPAEKKDITITGIVPADWDKCYLWAWGADGDFFAAWPGQERPIVDGKVSYTFSQVVPPVNVIFSCPDKGQTNDITGITENQEYDIQLYLKIN